MKELDFYVRHYGKNLSGLSYSFFKALLRFSYFPKITELGNDRSRFIARQSYPISFSSTPHYPSPTFTGEKKKVSHLCRRKRKKVIETKVGVKSGIDKTHFKLPKMSD